MKNITVNIFIVPNAASCYDGCSGNGPCSGPTSYMAMREYADCCHAASRFGVIDILGKEVTQSTFWAQVWVHDPDHDNLTDHGCHGTILEEIADRAPDCLPVEFLRRVAAAGDAGVETIAKYRKRGFELDEPICIKWVSSQEHSRYRNFGSMNDALDHVLAAAKEYEKPEVKAAYEAYLKALADSKKAA